MPRKTRVDAERNREALVGAAKEVFAENGASASLEEIARRAGVGIGTLYRHFPTRDAMIESVCRRELELRDAIAVPDDDIFGVANRGRRLFSVIFRRDAYALLRESAGPSNEHMTQTLLFANLREVLD